MKKGRHYASPFFLEMVLLNNFVTKPLTVRLKGKNIFKPILMKNLYFLFFIFSASLSFSQDYLPEKSSIPFTLSPNGHIIVTAEINGVAGDFVFDTGAGMHVLIQDFADKVDNLKKTSHFHTGFRATGEKIVSDMWLANSVTLDDFQDKNALVTTYDIDLPIAGLLSLTAFQDKAITIDYDNKILTIESANSLKNREEEADYELPLLIKNDMGVEVSIGTRVTLNDTLNLNVGLDSGAGTGVYRFNSRYMEVLGVDSTQVETKTRPSSFKPEHNTTYHFAKLSSLTGSNKNVRIENFKATFIDDLLYEGIMGIDWLGNIITIDMAGEKLWVKG